MLAYIWREQDDLDIVDEKGEKPEAYVATLAADADPEAAETQEYKRRHVGLALGINIFVQMLTLETLIREYLEDGYWPRFFIALAIPFQFCVSQVCLFSSLSISDFLKMVLTDGNRPNSSSVSSSSPSFSNFSDRSSKCTRITATTPANALSV